MIDLIAFRTSIVAAVAGLALSAAPATAHPHVLVDAKAEIVFDDSGRMAEVRHIWQFDEAFSAYATQGLDSDGDGKLGDAELAPLAKVNVESLKEFGFFTYLAVGKTDLEFTPPKEYWLELHGGRLTLFYTLPLKEPAAVQGKTTLEVFDPEYFVAFTFVKDNPIALDHAPAGCEATYHAPKELDASTAALLGSIPADQRDLPADLQEYAADLANIITVSCK